MVFPRVKSENLTEKEIFLNTKCYLTISRKYYDKGQIKLFKELFCNFSCKYCKLIVNVVEGDTACAVIGNTTYPLKEINLADNDYAIIIDDEKVSLSFNNSASFAHAFSTLLQLIEVRFEGTGGKAVCALPVTEIFDKPTLHTRMAHVCVFAESKFHRLRRTIREIGLYKYSHVILEFWGTYKFKCNKNLTAKNHLTKKQVALLLKEAKALGVQAVPMLNVWGHASLCRVKNGKHTPLDNSLKMQPYFSSSGWEWDILSPKVKKLHLQIIDELVALFKGTEYFHIGCDEAFTFGQDRRLNGKDGEKVISDYINSVNDYLKAKGLKTIMWGDMLLCNNSWAEMQIGVSQCGRTPEKAKKISDNLSKDIILADWQYWIKTDDIPTTKYLAEQGFNVMAAAWADFEPAKNCAKNVADNNYLGYMLTTWHTIPLKPMMIAQSGGVAWNGGNTQLKFGTNEMPFIANNQRKLLPAKNYKDSGCVENDLDII